MDEDVQTRYVAETAFSFAFTCFRFATKTAPPARTLFSVFFRYIFRRVIRNRSHSTISLIPSQTFFRFFRYILSLLPPSSHLYISFPPPPPFQVLRRTRAPSFVSFRISRRRAAPSPAWFPVRNPSEARRDEIGRPSTSGREWRVLHRKPV
jgi:hypothetical protein